MVLSTRGISNQMVSTDKDCEVDSLGELGIRLPSDDCKEDGLHASWPPSNKSSEISTPNEVKEESDEFLSLSNDEITHSIGEKKSSKNEDCEKDPLAGELKNPLPLADKCKKDLVHKFHVSSPPSILRRGRSMSDDVLFRKPQFSTDRTTSKVSFQSVKIREYKIALVANPGCARGPPIGLGDSYTEKDDIDLHTYEIERGPRRNATTLKVDKRERKNILKFATDHTKEEIKQITKDVKLTRYGRSFSNAMYPLLDAKEALGDAGIWVIRKIKNKKVDPVAHF